MINNLSENIHFDIMRQLLLFLSIPCFLLCSCERKRKTADVAQIKQAMRKNTLNGSVSLRNDSSVFRLSKIPDNLHIEMVNNTKDTIITGMHYDIEKLQNKRWIKILPEQPFQDIGMALHPADSKGFTVKLLSDQVKYKPGRFRVVKYYFKDDFQKSRMHFSTYLEFRVE